MPAFSNARQIWSHTRGFDRWKLLLAQAAGTRPQIAPLCRALLNAVSKDGIFWASYSTGHGTIKSSFRLGQLQSDIQSCLEVGIGNCYKLPQELNPELILDCGGNVGLFTLCALTRWPDAQVTIFEPVPENIERIQAHLAANHRTAQLNPFCLGASGGTTKFYCREANQGSFSDDLPYTHAIDVQVASLRPFLPQDPETPCLIKVDIEGGELEVVPDVVSQLSPRTLVVGELHQREKEQAGFGRTVTEAGRRVEFFDEGTCAMFHIQTPLAQGEVAEVLPSI